MAYAVWGKQEIAEIADGVAALAVDFDKLLPPANVVDQVFAGIELLSQLIEIGHFKAGAQLNRALLWCQFPQNKF